MLLVAISVNLGEYGEILGIVEGKEQDKKGRYCDNWQSRSFNTRARVLANFRYLFY